MAGQNYDATWNQLIKALKSPSVQTNYLAGQLEQMLITERNIYVMVLHYVSLKMGDSD